MPRVFGNLLACVCACLAFGRTPVSADSPQASAPRAPLAGIAIDESLDRESALLAGLPRPADALPPLIARVTIDLGRAAATEDAGAFLAELDRRLNAYAARQVSVVLDLGRVPAGDDQVDSWRQSIRAVAEHLRGKVAGYQVGTVAAAGPPPSIDRYLFLLRVAAVQLRSADGAIVILAGSLPSSFDEWLARVYATGLAPYVDGVAIAGPSAVVDAAFGAGVERMRTVVDREDPGSVVVAGPIALNGSAEEASARFFEAGVRWLGTSVRVVSYTGGLAAVRSALEVAARSRDLFNGTLVPVDEAAARLRLRRGGADLTTVVPHRLLFSTSSAATLLIYGGGTDRSALDVELAVAGPTSPQVRDPVAGTSMRPARTETRDGRVSLSVPVAGHSLVLDLHAGATDRFVENTDVQLQVLPSVDEIIARHQQAQAGQDAALGSYIARMRLEQHFHPSPSEPAWNIVTENRVFFERGAVEWEELSFSLNGATWTENRPPFPLVQPEKVLSLPLDLRLSQDYRYRLDGTDVVQGRPAYVIRFEPKTSGRALYRGTVWIDRQEHVRLKVQAVETALSGMVVSNDETHIFRRIGELQGTPVWLLDRQTSRQTFLMAGRTVLVEREARVTDVVLNPVDFDGERSGARASSRIMYRDTEQGLRYLVKRGNTRVVSDQMTTSTKAMAFGTQIDPSFDYPLPLGGLNILDFDFLNKDLQFALLFAGVFGAGNIQKANLWGGRFDASVDFFYLAVKSNDSLFDAHGEQALERVGRVPASTGVNVGFQANPFQKVMGRYEFKYDFYVRDPGTAADFTLPSSAGTHGAGAGYEYRRRGYSLAANLTAYRRSGARPWGPAGSLEPARASYTKYDVGVSKDFIFATFHTVHLNGAYFGGDGLDRFSMYQFGYFDPARMHGVPSAVRFAELMMFRGSYSFNLFEQYRVDLFVDHARGRDAIQYGARLPVTGLGLGLNLRAPRNTILRVDLGRSFLPDAYRGAGSTVMQIMLLKPL